MQPSSNEVCRLGFGPHSLCVCCAIRVSFLVCSSSGDWLMPFLQKLSVISPKKWRFCVILAFCVLLYWRSLACEDPVVLLSCWFWCCFDLCFFFKIVCLLVFGDPRCLTATKWTGVAAMSFKGFIGLVVFSNRVAAEWKRRSMVLYTGPSFKN